MICILARLESSAATFTVSASTTTNGAAAGFCSAEKIDQNPMKLGSLGTE
jgi:hypothetical protein